jgi:hypothetical protein
MRLWQRLSGNPKVIGDKISWFLDFPKSKKSIPVIREKKPLEFQGLFH